MNNQALIRLPNKHMILINESGAALYSEKYNLVKCVYFSPSILKGYKCNFHCISAYVVNGIIYAFFPYAYIIFKDPMTLNFESFYLQENLGYVSRIFKYKDDNIFISTNKPFIVKDKALLFLKNQFFKDCLFEFSGKIFFIKSVPGSIFKKESYDLYSKYNGIDTLITRNFSHVTFVHETNKKSYLLYDNDSSLVYNRVFFFKPDIFELSANNVSQPLTSGYFENSFFYYTQQRRFENTIRIKCVYIGDVKDSEQPKLTQEITIKAPKLSPSKHIEYPRISQVTSALYA